MLPRLRWRRLGEAEAQRTVVDVIDVEVDVAAVEGELLAVAAIDAPRVLEDRTACIGPHDVDDIRLPGRRPFRIERQAIAARIVDRGAKVRVAAVIVYSGNRSVTQRGVRERSRIGRQRSGEQNGAQPRHGNTRLLHWPPFPKTLTDR